MKPVRLWRELKMKNEELNVILSLPHEAMACDVKVMQAGRSITKS